jgi:hypothetical protein
VDHKGYSRYFRLGISLLERAENHEFHSSTHSKFVDIIDQESDSAFPAKLFHLFESFCKKCIHDVWIGCSQKMEAVIFLKTF